jgi:xylulokinase
MTICGGPSLQSKLMNPVPSYACLGRIHSYFVKRYGFNEECKVIVFSGDNPCSLVGSGILNPGVVGISLGTSDTIFSLIEKNEAKCNFDGHLFVSPTNENQYMMMACMKNGALIREKFKKLHAYDNWEDVDKFLNESNPGNNGIIGFFFDYPEISPAINVENFSLFQGKNGEEINIEKLKNEEIIRAVMESKAFLLKLALEKFGIKHIEKVVVTGGSSKCKGLIQIISDVFNCEIYKLENMETAAIGAAFRAFHGYDAKEMGNIWKFKI